jgi:hypothetical protein
VFDWAAVIPITITANNRPQFLHFSPNFTFIFGAVFGEISAFLGLWHFPNNRVLLLVFEGFSQKQPRIDLLVFYKFSQKCTFFLVDSRFFPNLRLDLHVHMHILLDSTRLQDDDVAPITVATLNRWT